METVIHGKLIVFILSFLIQKKAPDPVGSGVREYILEISG
jgi:hypothetical protein